MSYLLGHICPHHIVCVADAAALFGGYSIKIKVAVPETRINIEQRRFYWLYFSADESVTATWTKKMSKCSSDNVV